MASDTSLVFNLVARDRASAVVSGMKEKISTAAAGIGAAVGAAMAVGVTGSLNVEAANDKLAAQLGLTAPESARIGKLAGSLYKDAYGDSIEQVNDAVGAVMSSIKGMSTASSKDLEAASVKALDFAATFDIDVTQAVQSMGTLMNTGLAKDSTEAFDLITAASQKVPAQLREDVLASSDEYGQFFDTLGFDGPQAFAILVDASKKGQFGIDKAGDAIKEFTLLSTDLGSGSVTDAYKLIGLNARDMSNAILEGGPSAQDATQKIISGLLGIKDPSKQAEAAVALFGTPIEDLNKADIPEFLQSLKGASGSMDDFGGASKRSGDALNDNAKVALEGFKRTVETKLIEVGGKFVQFALDNQQVFVPLGIALAGIATTILIVKGAMIAWTVATQIWTGVQAIATAAQWLWNAALSANPIGLVIIAIAALIAIIVFIATKTTFFQDLWKAVWGAISGAASAAWTFMRDNVFLPIGRFFTETIPRWAGIVRDKVVGAWTATGTKIRSVVGGIVSWVRDKWNGFIGFFAGLPGRIAGTARGMFNGIKDSFRSAINWVIGRWNNFSFTIGGGSVLGVNIPSVTLGTPNIPFLAGGGTITSSGSAIVGEAGPELLSLPRGAAVTPLSRGAGAGGRTVIEIRSGGSKLDDLLVEILRRAVRVQGGNVQVVLGTGA